MSRFQPLYRGVPVFLDEHTPTNPQDNQPLDNYEELDLNAQIYVILHNLFGQGYMAQPLHLTGEYNIVFLANALQSGGSSNSAIPNQVVVRFANRRKNMTCMDIKAEVATMVHVRQQTSNLVPVPKVYAYCTNRQFFGENFIAMEYIPSGTSIGAVFPTLAPERQESFMREWLNITLALSRVRKSTIGSLYQAGGRLSVIGPSSFLNHAERSRLPTHQRFHEQSFNSAVEWLTHLIQEHLALTAARAAGTHPRSRGALDAATQTQLLNNVLRWLPLVLVKYDGMKGTFGLVKGLIGPNDVLVEPDGPNAGHIVSMLSWECTNLYPLWLAPFMPGFLGTADSTKKMFNRLLVELDSEGLLVQCMRDQYRMLAELAAAIESGEGQKLARWLSVSGPILVALQMEEIELRNPGQAGRQSSTGAGAGGTQQSSAQSGSAPTQARGRRGSGRRRR